MSDITEVGTMTDAEWELYVTEQMDRAERRHYAEKAEVYADMYGDDDDFEAMVDTRQWA